jgi:hypothetical protein
VFDLAIPMGVPAGLFLAFQACPTDLAGQSTLTNAATMTSLARSCGSQPPIPSVASVGSPTTALVAQVSGLAADPGAEIVVTSGSFQRQVTASGGFAGNQFSLNVPLTRDCRRRCDSALAARQRRWLWQQSCRSDRAERHFITLDHGQRCGWSAEPDGLRFRKRPDGRARCTTRGSASGLGQRWTERHRRSASRVSRRRWRWCLPELGRANPAGNQFRLNGGGLACGTKTQGAAGWLERGKPGAEEHSGLDILGTKGAAVYPVLDGTVVFTAAGVKGYGNMVVIEHAISLDPPPAPPVKFRTLYGHLENEPTHLTAGSTVFGGATRIGSVGVSGNASDPGHLDCHTPEPHAHLGVFPITVPNPTGGTPERIRATSCDPELFFLTPEHPTAGSGRQSGWADDLDPTDGGWSERVSFGGVTTPVAPDGTFSISVPIQSCSQRVRGTTDVGGERFSWASGLIRPGPGVVTLRRSSFIVAPPAPASLTASMTTAVLTGVGQTAQVRVLAEFADGSRRDVTVDPATCFQSSNETIAEVNADGLVKATGEGTAYITIRHEGISAALRATVSLGRTATLRGRIVDALGLGVPSATVLTGAFRITASGDGTFATQLPGSIGPVVVAARAERGGQAMTGQSRRVPVSVGRVTDIGNLVVDIDTDGDGLPDYYERTVHGTDPYDSDSDDDGLTDGVEVVELGTDPKQADTDGDGIRDDVEAAAGSNPRAFDRTTTFTGVVTLPDGRPAANALVGIHGIDRDVFAARVDASGAFVLPPWPQSASGVVVSARLGSRFGKTLRVATTPGVVVVDAIVVHSRTGPAFVDETTSEASGVRGTAIADLDSDGVMDAVAWLDSDTIRVFLGEGDGTLRSEDELAAPRSPQRVAIGDLDLDGHPDLACVGLESSVSPANVAVYRGIGAARFALPSYYEVGIFPSDVAITDLDRDGIPDLVVGNNTTVSNPSTVSVLRGIGGGLFAPATTTVTGGNTLHRLEVADLDIDGFLDVVCTDNRGLFVLRGTGGGRLRAGVLIAPLPNAQGLIMRDLNRDSIPDAAVTQSTERNVHVLLGVGDGTLAPAFVAASGTQPLSIDAADLDGDRVRELAVANGGSFTGISIFRGLGDGTVTPLAQESGRVSIVHDVRAVDLDGNGTFDLMAAGANLGNPQRGSVSIHMGAGDGRFPDPDAYPLDDRPIALADGDFDGNGLIDVAALHASFLYAEGRVHVLLRQTGGAFMPMPSLPFGSIAQYAEGLAAGDLNGDGRVDLAVAQTQPWEIIVRLGNGDGTFGAATSFPSVPSQGYGRTIRLADIDGDRALDVVLLRVPSVGGNIHWMRGTGDGTLGAAMQIPVGPFSGNAGDVQPRDLDGDGHVDLLLDWNNQGLAVLRGLGSGTFAPLIALPGTRSGTLATGDVNGDGVLDIVSSSAQTLSVHIGLGGAMFGPASVHTVDPDTFIHHASLADVDRDGWDDVVGRRAETGAGPA